MICGRTPDASLAVKPDVCAFPNQHHVVVKGLHFVQEDSPDEIGQAITGWLERI